MHKNNLQPTLHELWLRYFLEHKKISSTLAYERLTRSIHLGKFEIFEVELNAFVFDRLSPKVRIATPGLEAELHNLYQH